MKAEKTFSPLRLLGTLGVILFLIIAVYPIIWLLLSSFKTEGEIALSASYALPHTLYLENYAQAWERGKMSIFLKNSIYTTAFSLIFIVLLAAPAAFGITKMKWKLSGAVSTMFLLGIMIPVQVMLIPLFLMFKWTNTLNTLEGLIVAFTAFGLPMSIYLFSGYFKSIPNEMIEAAVIDGCTIYQVFVKIMLPLIKNAVVTILMISFMDVWNDLLFSMTFISSTELKTLQTGLIMFQGRFGAREWGPTYAAIAMGTLPTLVLYLFLNKVMIEGLTAGAVKG
jgi:raffinose/stachyose/melibiose transport system permease protein